MSNTANVKEQISRTLLALLVAVLSPSVAWSDFAPEPLGVVETLPAQLPEDWVLVHDFSFFHMLEGKVLVIDPTQDNPGAQYKGMMTASFISAFASSAQRNEYYIAETFYSRGGRGGERTDVVAIYDPSTLSVAAEVVIPSKRITGMPKPVAAQLIGNDRFMGVYNFTPSQSVSIVDLESRTFVEEISTAGCSFVIPNGERSFSSICSNGSFLTTHLDKSGKAVGTSRTESVFSVDDDPVFETPGFNGNGAHFVTFAGRVLPVDTTGKELSFGEVWWLTESDERNWRPGGMNVITTDGNGLAYVLMNPEGGEGTHKDGGMQVWVYDLQQRKRLRQIELQSWGLSLGMSSSKTSPHLFVTNAEMAVDMYNAATGEFVKTLNTGAATPFLVYGTR